MIEKTRGVVLHTLRYGDTKSIVTLFTESRGAVSFMVRIPQSHRSALQNILLSPLSLLEVDFDYQETQKLQRLIDIRVDEPYQSLPYNPMKQTIALFLSEFLYYSLREEQENPELFAYLSNSLLWLDNRSSGFANFPLTFLIRLSRFLGFWPNTDVEDLSSGVYVFDLVDAEMRTTQPPHGSYLEPREAALVPILIRMDFGTMHLFRFSREQRARLMQILNDYYRLHIPHFPELKSMAILREVLS
ncbi:MAG: DNA repair protein RecO [Bacteroidaceae bacterium]|nr:DNA repair protein RecO [Bacteroidaceae bacterium]